MAGLDCIAVCGHRTGDSPLLAGCCPIDSGHDDDIAWSGVMNWGGQLARDFARLIFKIALLRIYPAICNCSGASSK